MKDFVSQFLIICGVQAALFAGIMSSILSPPKNLQMNERSPASLPLNLSQNEDTKILIKDSIVSVEKLLSPLMNRTLNSQNPGFSPLGDTKARK